MTELDRYVTAQVGWQLARWGMFLQEQETFLGSEPATAPPHRSWPRSHNSVHSATSYENVSNHWFGNQFAQLIPTADGAEDYSFVRQLAACGANPGPPSVYSPVVQNACSKFEEGWAYQGPMGMDDGTNDDRKNHYMDGSEDTIDKTHTLTQAGFD